jgi:NTP pyrophosphatase (non-canonical NTP hydrolase)
MTRQQAVNLALKELSRAEKKHPKWPTDPVHASAILNEEAGELTQACLQFYYEGKSGARMEEEAAQVAAMAIRFLMGIDGGEDAASDHPR